MQLFSIEHTCPHTAARTGVISTPHGDIPTPVFMPLATRGTVKSLDPDDINKLGASILLGNTYHLYLRPGTDLISKFGGLHSFMSWEGPLLTDSGGFQVFSLGHLRHINDDGVLFRSHIDGSEHFFTPELSIEIQQTLGGDIIMAFDECPPYDADLATIQSALNRTHQWAIRCMESHHRTDQALFGIVQGGTSLEMRRESVESLISLDLPGYAIGGLSVGEPKDEMYPVAKQTAAWLPEEKPRYLMGVGSPEDLVECVSYGIDMFDCALPTRIARNGALFTSRGRVNIRNARFKEQMEPIARDCGCYTCRSFSAAYLHHLFKCEELLGYRLATIHNLHFIIRLMDQIREAISNGTFDRLKRSFLESFQPVNEEVRIAQKAKWVKAQRLRKG